MPIERNLRGYGRTRPDVVWPNGARVAVSLVVNFEEGAELAVEQGDAETERYGEIQSTLPAGVRDLVQEQTFDYGMRVGLWRFLDAFAEHKVSKRHLRRLYLPHLWRFLPLPVMERLCGQYLILKAFKPLRAALDEAARAA